MMDFKDYSKQNKQSIWTKPIYIHVMPQLRRKVPNKTFVLAVSSWVVILALAAVYFLIK